MSDLINRQMVLDVLDAMQGSEVALIQNSKIWQQIKDLPSAQPEPLTDKEQRIFLAAMGREEKICKKVDDDFRKCIEPYENSLVRTCHEIIRKVKGALWT